MASIGSVTAEMSLNISRFSRTLSSALKEISAAGDRMEDAFGRRPRKAIQETEDTLSRFTWTARGYFKDVSKVITGILISQGFYKLLNTLQDATRSVVEFNDELQKAAISFDILLGSQAKADKFITTLQDFASVTPFTFMQAQKSAQQMLAMGFNPEAVLPTLKTVLDAAAIRGGGPDVVDGIVRALGQMATKGRIATQEMLQLTERGVPAFRILHEQLGLSYDKLADIGNLRIPANVGIAALLKGIQEDFAGASERIARTSGGLMSSIKDNLLILGNMVAAGPLEGVRQKLETVSDTLVRWVQITRGGGIGKLFEALVPPNMQNTLRTVVAGVRSLFQAFNELRKALAPILSAFGELAANFAALIIPVLTLFFNLLAKMIGVITTNTAVVKGLVGAIGSLAIAGLVLKTLTGLATAINFLSVAGPVAKMIDMLTASVKLLTIAMIKNPIIGVVSLLAGVLLGLALSSETASRWLDSLMDRLVKFAGLDVSSTLDPISGIEMGSALDDYNRELNDVLNNLIDTGAATEEAGDAADDAADKFKKFIAPFDEVFQVPEDAEDALGGIQNALDNLPAVPDLPSLGGVEVGGPGSIGGAGSVPSIVEQLRNMDPIDIPVIIGPPPGGPTPTAFAESFENAMQRIQRAFASLPIPSWNQQWQENQTATKSWTETVKERVRDAMENAGQQLRECGQALQAWGSLWGTVIATSVSLGVAKLKGRFSELKTGLTETLTQLHTNAEAWATSWGTTVATNVATGLATIKETFRGLKDSVITYWNDAKLGVIVGAGLLVAGVVAALGILSPNLVPIVAGVVTRFGLAWNSIQLKFGEMLNGLQTKLGTFTQNLPATMAKISGHLNGLRTSMQTNFAKIQTFFSELVAEFSLKVNTIPDKFKEAIAKIPELISNTFRRLSDGFRPLTDLFSKVSKAFGGSSISYSVPNVSAIAGYAKGTVVRKPQIAALAENNKKEAVIPLETRDMVPFANAIAEALGSVGGTSGRRDSDLPPMYVGTLVADDRSLKQLERKLEVIRVRENGRRGK